MGCACCGPLAEGGFMMAVRLFKLFRLRSNAFVGLMQLQALAVRLPSKADDRESQGISQDGCCCSFHNSPQNTEEGGGRQENPGEDWIEGVGRATRAFRQLSPPFLLACLLAACVSLPNPLSCTGKSCLLPRFGDGIGPSCTCEPLSEVLLDVMILVPGMAEG